MRGLCLGKGQIVSLNQSQSSVFIGEVERSGKKRHQASIFALKRIKQGDHAQLLPMLRGGTSFYSIVPRNIDSKIDKFKKIIGRIISGDFRRHLKFNITQNLLPFGRAKYRNYTDWTSKTLCTCQLHFRRSTFYWKARKINANDRKCCHLKFDKKHRELFLYERINRCRSSQAGYQERNAENLSCTQKYIKSNIHF